MQIAQPDVVQNYPIQLKAVQRRSKGERTREKILLAAINILSTHGIKGTTHRAVANYAQIQLSLTTYYFKDIGELILAAFQLNSENLRAKNDIILEEVFTTLDSIDKTSLRKVSVKIELCEKLSDLTANYLFSNIQKESTSFIVERLMLNTVQVTDELKKLALEHEISQLKPFTKFAKYFNKKDPEIDAQIMRTTFLQLKCNQLPLEGNDIALKPIKDVCKKLIGWVMGIKH
jgi:DNA-binding transcriptional regulator YbjK